MLILLLAWISLLGASHAQAFIVPPEAQVAVYLDTTTCEGERPRTMPYSWARTRYGSSERDVSFKYIWPMEDGICHRLGISSMNVCGDAVLWSAAATCAALLAAAEFGKKRIPMLPTVSRRACIVATVQQLGCRAPEVFDF